MKTREAVIVGGGIGGLTAALCLTANGWKVTVLEQAAEIAEIGAGLQLSPNGTRILQELGLWPRLENTAFRPAAVELVDGPTGRRIFVIPMGAAAEERWGAPYVQIHRADLVEALRAELEDRAPGSIRTGAGVTGYAHAGNGAEAILMNGDRVGGDLVVAADGLRSTIRNQMLGRDRPQFTGNVAWRTTVPIDRLGRHVPPPTGRIWAGHRRHVVTTRVRAGKVANFVGIVEDDSWREEGWNFEGDRAEAISLFGGWSPVIDTILEQCDTIRRWALFGRAPLPRWSDGAVVLLGDACHPMLPSFAQGAVQAIEDAGVLARTVTGIQSVAEAGEAYYSARIARTTRVQVASMNNMRLYHAGGFPAGWLAFPVIGAVGRIAPGLLLRRLDWLYGARV